MAKAKKIIVTSPFLQEVKVITEAKFNELWSLEEKRIRGLWDGLIEYENNPDNFKIVRQGRMPSNNKDFAIEDYAINRIAPNKNYNSMHPWEYKAVKQLQGFLYSIKRIGIAPVLSDIRKNWHEGMHAKLNLYLNKFILPEDKFTRGIVELSNKGFTMTVAFTRNGQNMIFKTICFDAGGHNIQEFHFRYKGSIQTF